MERWSAFNPKELERLRAFLRFCERRLALPIIGTLDSERAQVIMESLLGAIVKDDEKIAIIDITGVPAVDTLVAQHLLKTVTATRLMGADCIISGVRPQIARTIVHLGINLQDITTKATLADVFPWRCNTLALRPNKERRYDGGSNSRDYLRYLHQRRFLVPEINLQLLPIIHNRTNGRVDGSAIGYDNPVRT